MTRIITILAQGESRANEHVFLILGHETRDKTREDVLDFGYLFLLRGEE